MRYKDLDTYWKRIFELEWISLCEGSKAIAALIVSNDGSIISEGRNKIGEECIPNPRISHAEVEAIRNLDVSRYPDVKEYTLYTALEPCPMCMGTMVMGGIRSVVIGAKELICKGIFVDKKPSSYCVEEIFDMLMSIIEKQE